MLTLYDYYRSSACYRVRIALHFKGLPFEKITMDLVKDGGEQHQPQYLAMNPQRLVPTLIDDDKTLTQSIAILEYLEEQYPSPALLPSDATARARVRSMAQTIACDMGQVQRQAVRPLLRLTRGIQRQAH